MFDISFWELVVIGVVGLIVIGPERLPEVARTVGKYVGRMRRFVAKVKDDIDREIRQDGLREDLKRHADLDGLKKIFDDSRYTIEEEVRDTKQHVVSARDDDPRGNFSQTDLLKEQEKDFDNEDYGLTDHQDYGIKQEPEQPDQTLPDNEAPVQPIQTAQVTEQSTVTPKQNDGRSEKSNS